MKMKFSAIPERVVTIYRNEESIEFSLRALPVGYSTYLESVYPKPVIYVDGAPISKDDDPEYWDLYQYLLLGRSLEHTDMMENQPPKGNEPAAWQQYAYALREEFREAQFTSGEVGALVSALGELNEAQTAPAQKRTVGNA
jgi:hypothetical protein